MSVATESWCLLQVFPGIVFAKLGFNGFALTADLLFFSFANEIQIDHASGHQEDYKHF